MIDLLIDPTSVSPLVDFRADGNLLIQGRSVPEDSVKFYRPLVEWMEGLTCNHINFDVKFEYLNTSSTKQLFLIFKQLEDRDRFKSVIINWHYEEDDEDMLESGEYYESLLENIDFQYTACAEIV